MPGVFESLAGEALFSFVDGRRVCALHLRISCLLSWAVDMQTNYHDHLL